MRPDFILHIRPDDIKSIKDPILDIGSLKVDTSYFLIIYTSMSGSGPRGRAVLKKSVVS